MLGRWGLITFSLEGGAPVTELAVDLLGDGLPAPTVVRGEDLRMVVAVRWQPGKLGDFEVQVRAVDACGSVETTTMRRVVRVIP